MIQDQITADRHVIMWNLRTLFSSTDKCSQKIKIQVLEMKF